MIEPVNVEHCTRAAHTPISHGRFFLRDCADSLVSLSALCGALSLVCVCGSQEGAIGKKKSIRCTSAPPYQHPPTSRNRSNSRLPTSTRAGWKSNGLDGRRLKEHLRPRPNKLTMWTTGGLRFVLGLPPAAPACAYCEYSHGKVLPVSTACVTAPPKANIASRPLASSFICISSFFAGSEMKPIGSKPVAARDGARVRRSALDPGVHACRALDPGC